MSGPKIRRYNEMYYLFYIAGRKWKMVSGKPELFIKIRLATSADGESWQRLIRFNSLACQRKTRRRLLKMLFTPTAAITCSFATDEARAIAIEKWLSHRIRSIRTSFDWNERDDLAGITISKHWVGSRNG